jgi:hypothetical protein
MIPFVTVRPLPSGWQVEAFGHEPLVFSSGAQAERSARRLAEALAEKEGAAAVRIYLRDGALGGRFLCSRASLQPA